MTEEKKEKVGLIWGCFEHLHYGHIKLFENAKKHCDHLIVCVHDDAYIEKFKNHKPAISAEFRAKVLESVSHVDRVDIQSSDFPDRMEAKKQMILKYNPDVILVADCWTPQTFTGMGLGPEVIFLPYTGGISSTDIRKSVVKNFKE